MKMYIAFAPSNACNSGMKSREEAEKWAAKTLADRPNVENIIITEVIGTLNRTAPAVEFVPYVDKSEESKPSLAA
jgi:hypothetical protein